MIVPLVLICLYFALQPLIPNPFVWKTLPEIPQQQKEVNNKDSLWIRPIAAAQKLLIEWQQKLQAPSLSVAIGHRDKVLWAEAIGYADIAAQKVANENTIYRIGSISKSVTSVALATLLEQKKIQLDEPIGRLLPNYKLTNPNITPRQLASHTAGIRHYNFCFCLPIHEGFNNEPFNSVQEAVAVFSKDNLLFEPGNGFNYSTYGYTLLSAVMEAASQQPFPEYLQKEILDPLSMKHTLLGRATIPNKDIATFYTVKENQYKPAFEVDISNKWAGGGLLSTPTDLVKMGNALLDSTFLSAETKMALFTPQTLNNGAANPQNYGLGWRIDVNEKNFSPRKVKIIHHGGTIEGAIALLLLFPDYDFSIALMTNRSGRSSELFKPIYQMVIPFIEAQERKDFYPENLSQ